MSAEAEKSTPNSESASVTIVTGAAQGLGRQIAASVAALGGHVILCDIDERKVSETASAIDSESAGFVRGVALDVRDADGWKQVVSETLAAFGRLDNLVNNAGTLEINSIVDTSPENFRRVIDVNVTGVFLGMQAVLPILLGQGSGAIVNLSSLAGKKGMPDLSAYCASKAAVISLTQSAALEAAPAVRVNAVCPGVVNTEMQQREYELISSKTGQPAEEIEQQWLDDLPMKRFQEPSDIADAVAFLLGNKARNITGEALNVNGGLLMD